MRERERERQRWRTWTQTDRGLLYWPHSELHLVLLLLLHQGPLHLTWMLHPKWLLPWLDCPVIDWLNNYHWVPVIISSCSIYSYRCQPTWPASTVLLFTQLEHPVLEIHNWRVCQKNTQLKYQANRFKELTKVILTLHPTLCQPFFLLYISMVK